MANGHRAAVDVTLVHIEAERLLGGDGHAAEGFVHLPQINVLDAEASLRPKSAVSVKSIRLQRQGANVRHALAQRGSSSAGLIPATRRSLTRA